MPALLLLLAAIVGPASGAFASGAAQNQPGLSVTARGGFGGTNSYMIGEWFPVHVTLANPSGAPSMRVSVEVDSLGPNSNPVSIYVRDIDLPSPSRKEVTLYASTNSYDHAVEVRVVANGTAIYKSQVPVSPLDPSTDVIIGVISPDASLLNILKGEKVGHTGTLYYGSNFGGPTRPLPGSGASATVTVEHIDIKDLPTLSPALDSLGALVLDGVDTSSLSTEQRGALEAWVARGGTLVLAVQPGAADVGAGLRNLLPVTPSGTRMISSLKGLSDLIMAKTPLGQATFVTDSSLRTDTSVGAHSLALGDGVPLIAERALGEGQVIYFAFSPGVEPLRTWDGIVPLFKRLLIEHNLTAVPLSLQNVGYYSGYGSGLLFNAYGDFFDLPGLDLPEPAGIALFLLLYILIVGPVNFVVLRRLRRPELAWVTVPALVVLFSVVGYVIGYGSKGGDLVMPRASLVSSAVGTREASTLQVWGLFSPLRRAYNITLGADSVATPYDRYGGGGGGTGESLVRVQGGNPSAVENVVIDTGSLKGFVSENGAETAPALSANLRLDDNLIVGTVRNETSAPLQDVALFRGAAVQHLGYLAAGATARVNLSVSTLPFDNSTPATILPPPPGVGVPGSMRSYSSSTEPPEQRAYNRKINLLNLALGPVVTNDPPTDMNVMALAWGGPSPVSVDVVGQTARIDDITLQMARFPVTAGSGGHPALRRGSAPLWVYVPGGNPEWTAGPRNSSQVLSSYADIHYALPAGTKPESLGLYYPYAGSASANPLADNLLAYNVNTGAWEHPAFATRASAQDGSTFLSFDNPADYVGPSGNVTVRIISVPGTALSQSQQIDLLLNEVP